jgi:hypothetical protein
MKEIKSLVTNESRIEMAGSIQRTLNSFWEARIMKYALECEKTNMELDTANLNMLIKEYLNLEQTLSYMACKFGLKISFDTFIKTGKLKNIPRRFKVTLTESGMSDIRHCQTITNTFIKAFKIERNVVYLYANFNNIKEIFNIRFTINDYIRIKYNDMIDVVCIDSTYAIKSTQEVIYKLVSVNDSSRIYRISLNELRKYSLSV